MKSKLLKLTTVFLTILGLSTTLILPLRPAYAEEEEKTTTTYTDICDSNSADVPQAVRDAAGCGGGEDRLPDVIVFILNAIIAISGLVAVVFVIIGGISYMTSTGDPGKTKKAKDTILYALIGMVVCVLAFAIVNWVVGILKNSNNGNNNNNNNQNNQKTSLIIPSDVA